MTQKDHIKIESNNKLRVLPSKEFRGALFRAIIKHFLGAYEVDKATVKREFTAAKRAKHKADRELAQQGMSMDSAMVSVVLKWRCPAL